MRLVRLEGLAHLKAPSSGLYSRTPVRVTRSMGNSQFIPAEDLQRLQDETKLSHEEMRKLYRRFRKLDTDGSGDITVDELKAIPELAAV